MDFKIYNLNKITKYFPKKHICPDFYSIIKNYIKVNALKQEI